MERSAGKKVQFIVTVGIMSAMVFALSAVRIMIPSPVTNAAIQFGNIMCILSGLLFGGVGGGLSSGFGSLFYDFTNPLYIAESPITFINKFIMGCTAGFLNRKIKMKNIYFRSVIAAIAGQAVYIVLYISKSFIFSFFLYGNAFETAIADAGVKTVTSSVNAIIAVVCAVPLYFIIRNILIKTPYKTIITNR